MMNTRVLISLAAAGAGLFFGGCTMAPKYTRIDAPVPEQWAQNDAAAADAAQTFGLGWREFMADKKLISIIECALANNRDLQLAGLNVERARALYGIQRAELVPTVSATGAGAKSHVPADLSSSGQAVTSEEYSVGLGVAAWELDFFGRIRSLKNQALEAYLASDEARRSARVSVIAETARVYLTLAADREKLELALSTMLTQQNAYDIVKKRFDAGLATELDLSRARIPVETARVALASLRQLCAQDKNALDLLAGQVLSEEMLPVGLADVVEPLDISSGLSSETLLSRPDIMAAEHGLKSAYALIGAARAAFFPRIALTTSFGTASSELSGLFDSGSDKWVFGPGLSMPVFDARVWAAYRVSKADREILLKQYEKAIQTAFREVADALAVRASIDEQVAAQQSLVDAVAKTYSLADERYKQGVDSYLGVLDAQKSFFEAQQALISVKLAKLANRVRLYAVLGGGADFDEPKAEEGQDTVVPVDEQVASQH
jgi:multidrug efflux system outer membrane protein